MLLTLQQSWQNLGPSLQSVFVLLIAGSLYLLLRSVVLRKFAALAQATSNDLDDRLVHLATQFTGVIALFCTVAALLHVNDVAVSPLLAGAGIVGVSLGFAAKETIADILAGIFLIIDQPIRIGDRIKIQKVGNHWGGWGDVVDIGLRRTRVRNTDGVYVNYPNSVFSSSIITNFSQEQEAVRVRIRFQVDYDADINRMKQATLDAINGCAQVVENSGQVLLRGVDDASGRMLTGILVEARYHLTDVRKRTVVRSEVLEAILDNLRQQQIPIATPKVRLEQELDWCETYSNHPDPGQPQTGTNAHSPHQG